MPSRRVIPYNTDPPSPASTGKPTLGGPIIDVERTRRAMEAGLIPNAIPSELKHPNDQLLIATVMSLGMPRWSAEQMPYHPGMRYNYLSLWFDVQDAARGDREAKQRIDAVRERFQEERQAERINDRPAHATGYVRRD